MKAIKVITTRSADRALAQLKTPLDVQIELLFSCVLRKRVLFRAPFGVVVYPMGGDARLKIHFRPVMTKVCLISDVDDVPDMEDFPIHDAPAFMPRWLKLDYRSGEWVGDYGWVGE